MYESAEEEASLARRSAYSLQFTHGTRAEYENLFESVYPDPHIVVECGGISSMDEVINEVAEQLSLDLSNDPIPRTSISMWFDENEGTLILYDYDTFDEVPARSLAQYLKGLSEGGEVDIALVVEDTDVLFRANPDLSGRVKTIDFDRYE
jgi:hypothetical protein